MNLDGINGIDGILTRGTGRNAGEFLDRINKINGIRRADY
jgi:hypothetical protein